MTRRQRFEQHEVVAGLLNRRNAAVKLVAKLAVDHCIEGDKTWAPIYGKTVTGEPS